MWRRASLGLCALVLAACGGGDDPPEPADIGLTPAELNWVRGFAAWGDDLGQAIADARAAQELALGGGDRSFATQALQPLRRCSASLEETVPDAPTPRLRAAAGLLEQTCRAYERYAGAQAQSLRGDPGAALLRAVAAQSRAEELLILLYGRIGGMLRDNRALPRTRGGGDSRVDPLYSRLGTELAYERVEIRCWEPREWPTVMRERTAFSNGYLDVHDTLGFAWPDDDRAHLAPEVCGALDRFSLDGEGAGTEDLATAVVVLAHEIGHLRARSAEEAEVECRAIQEARGVAKRLGATASQADELVDIYWNDVYPETDELYHSAQCRPGGYLDLDPAHPEWP